MSGSHQIVSMEKINILYSKKGFRNMCLKHLENFIVVLGKIRNEWFEGI